MRPTPAALSAALLSAALLAALALPPPAAGGPAAAETGKLHAVEKVTQDIYVITGRGGNVGLVVAARHAILIDDQFEDIAPGLLAAVRSVTDKPVKYLVNTHHHGDHTGANVVLEKQVQAIVAHANVRKRLELAQAKLDPARRGGLPEIAFGEEDPAARARLDIHLDGTEIHLAHYGPGHTDGDVLVGIPAARVMHMGDLFFNGLTPYIDVAAGGSLAGMIANVENVLARIPDDARVIPGHGPVGGKKDLARYRDFLRAVERHVQANPGKPGADLAASFDRSAFPDFRELPPFIRWADLFDLASGRVPKR